MHEMIAADFKISDGSIIIKLYCFVFHLQTLS